ncbi:MAG: anion permease [Clostridiales bacterium]|jgi:sodium-dependent dicarboxylate transporter 2/3/5|nr:anion permease [Clostridiales bacterium]
MATLVNGNNNMAYIKKIVWIVVIIAFYAITSNIAPPAGLSVEGWKAIIFMIVAIMTWVSEVVPVGIASCFLLFVPQLLGIQKTGAVLEKFAISTIFFIIASMLIAKAFINVGLGYRVSLYVTFLGNKSRNVLLSLMLVTALISSVLADIPTAIIVAGIAYTLLKESGCKPGESNFGRAVMVAIPIAAAIGGFATPAGSGLNVLSIDLLRSTTGIELTFLKWTAIGAPMAFVTIFAAWFIILKIFKPEIDEVKGLENLSLKRKEMGPLTKDEKKFGLIFICTLILWFTQPFTKLEIAFISLLAITVLALPGINLMDWKTAKDTISWDSILLVGSANAIAMILSTQGSAEWISNSLLTPFTSSGMMLLITIVTAFGMFIHLLVPVGNAVLSLCIPIVAIMAQNAGINPLYLILPLGYTASCVFLLPLDPIPLTTYGYGYWKLTDMSKTGFPIAIVWGIILVLLMMAAISFGII